MDERLETIRRHGIFTTHTPVPAGHDQFPRDMVERVLGQDASSVLSEAEAWHDGALNMTYLALRCSHYVNGVTMRHRDVSRGMFPRYPISAITNGVHAATWTSPPFRDLFDRHLAGWRDDNNYLRYAVGLSPEQVRRAHGDAKQILFDALRTQASVPLDETLMTIGFARRASTYKRGDMLFHNLDRLKWIARNVGPFQLVYAGKAHPHDEGGKRIIQQIHAAAAELRETIPTVYVENYDLLWGQLLTSGVDVWMNTPQRPQEASGTSGMKAALNGVPSFSVVDGWWIEGCIEGVTGWAIGSGEPTQDFPSEVNSLYDKLERVILPMYYARPDSYAEVMRSAIALNGAFFNTQRMVLQYLTNAYAPTLSVSPNVVQAATHMA
jgi:starch phosphorylase